MRLETFVTYTEIAGPGSKPNNMANAHRAVRKAVKEGTLERPTAFACVDCGESATMWEHASYEPENWLKVEPVCNTCNIKRGYARKAARREAAFKRRNLTP